MIRSKNMFLEDREESLSYQETGLTMELNSLLKSNKATITEKISDSLQKVNDGYVDPLDALIYAKKLEYVANELIKGLKGKAEITGSKFSRYNADVIESMTGVRYDCSVCGDPEYNDIVSKIEPLLEKKKEIEKRLKTITKKYTIVNEDTGETIEINPPIKSGSLSLKFTLK